MKKPSVSVILPAKDVGGYVGTTLSSLRRQFADTAELSVIAIDDGSTDDTGERMREHGTSFDHFELIENSAAVGLASARNLGLDHVETELFAFIDGDDWMMPRRLEALARALRSLDCDFVRTDHVTVEGTERTLRRAPFPFRGVVRPPRDAILPAHQTTMVDYPYAWAGMFHRRVIDQGLASFIDGLFTAEDRPWIWRLHLQADSFAVVDAPAVLYRRAVAGSLTQVVDSRQLHFLRAFGEAIRIVQADPQADRFLPKVIATALAVSAHHLARSGAMSRADRIALRSGVNELVTAMPATAVRDALQSGSRWRRRLLAPYIDQAGL